jgi:hypothetical protein
MKARDHIFVLILGLMIAVFSLIEAFSGIGLWYFPATVGIWFIFDYFSSIKNKNTTLQVFKENKKKFFYLYLLMFMFGCTIEVIGRFILKLWIYPFQDTIILELLGILFYPVILFSFREMYGSLHILIKTRWIAVISSMILGIVLWEIPNLAVYSWIYSIPFTELSIIGINIIVIIGWVLLIIIPVYIYNKFLKTI